MGNKIETKLLVLIGLFLLTCIFVYGKKESRQITQKPSLRHFLDHIDGYTVVNQIQLSENNYNMLALDDYTYTDYIGDNNKANLYIGYYYSADKAYASHSPTICFPSQGWNIDSQPTTHSLTVGSDRIHYEQIVTSRDEKRELVLYWYQSRLLTNTEIYKNKIAMGYNKLTHNDEQHAFVRVAIPLPQSTSRQEGEAVAKNFIRAFYPKFVDFIQIAGHTETAPI